MRLVIVTHFFPPDGGPGSIRPHALATALHEQGHEVLVLTACRAPEPAAFEVVSLPYSRLGSTLKRMTADGESANLGELAAGRGRLAGEATRLAAHWTEALFQHPDKYRGWVRAVARWWEEEGSSRRAPDAVIATTPPVSAALAGEFLAGRWKTRLLLDFRDLWTGSPYYRFGRLRRAVDRRAESRLAAAADVLVAATAPLRQALSAEHSRPDALLIRTGVLSSLLARGAAARRDPQGAMRVSHFGSMEDWVRRDAGPVLGAACALIDRGEIDRARLRIEFFGPTGTRLETEVAASGLADITGIHGRVPHEQALAELAASDVALLLMWPGDAQSVPMKATEYMAAGKTVLVFGAAADSEARQVLGGAQGVYFCDDQSDAERALLDSWRRFDSGESPDWPDPERARPFLAGTMADRFVEAVTAASANGPGGGATRVLLVGQAKWTHVLASGLDQYTGLKADAIPIDTVRDALGLLSPACWRRADVVMRVGFRPGAPTLRGRLFDAAFEAMRPAGTPVVYYWLGTDVLNLRHDVEAGVDQRRFHAMAVGATHLTDSDALRSDLAALGIEATTAWLPAPNAPQEGAVAVWPERFTVLSYVPDARPAFYDGPTLMEAARRLPAARFRVVGGTGSWAADAPANMEFLGWREDMGRLYDESSVLARLVEHDSVSCMAVEALAHGRAVIYSRESPNTIAVGYGDTDALEAALRRLMEPAARGEATVSPEAVAWARRTAEPRACYGEIAAVLYAAAQGR